MNSQNVQFTTIFPENNMNPLSCYHCHEKIIDTQTNEVGSSYACVSHIDKQTGKYSHHLHTDCYPQVYRNAQQQFANSKGLKNIKEIVQQEFMNSQYFCCPGCALPIEKLALMNKEDYFSGQKPPAIEIDRNPIPLIMKAKRSFSKGTYTGYKWGGTVGIVSSIYARNILEKIRLPIIIDLNGILGVMSSPFFGAIGGSIGEVTSCLTIDAMERMKWFETVNNSKLIKAGRCARLVGLMAIEIAVVSLISVSCLNRISISLLLPKTIRLAAILSLSVGIIKTSASRFKKQLSSN